LVGRFASRKTSRRILPPIALLMLSSGCFIKEVDSKDPENWPCDTSDDCHIGRECISGSCALTSYKFKGNATFGGVAPAANNVPSAMIFCVKRLGEENAGITEQIICSRGICDPTRESDYHEGEYLLFMGATGYETRARVVEVRDLGDANQEPCNEDNVCVVTLDLQSCEDPGCNPARELSCDAIEPDQAR